MAKQPRKTLHKSDPKPKKKRRPNPVIEVSTVHDLVGASSVTYQLERVSCGKTQCKKCAGHVRKGHGPYWFAYWTEGNKTRTVYIGKERRPASKVLGELAERRKERARERALTMARRAS
jgi:hypothetical protein